MSLTSRAGLAFLGLFHCLSFLSFVSASVFITYPYQGITCSGGSECMVTWADDGITPLLASVGPSDFALYQGTNALVQQLAAGLDVSQTRVLTFIPNSNAGPNADSYWIKMTSLSARDPNNTAEPYTSFSGFFTLDNMSGSEGNPVASLTSLSTSVSPTTSQLSSVTNGIVGTTTLPGVIPTGSASTLSSAISALSAISSAASGSLSQSQLLTTSSVSRTRTTGGTSSGLAPSETSSSSNGSERCFGRVPRFIRVGKLCAALVAVLVMSEISLG